MASGVFVQVYTLTNSKQVKVTKVNSVPSKIVTANEVDDAAGGPFTRPSVTGRGVASMEPREEGPPEGNPREKVPVRTATACVNARNGGERPAAGVKQLCGGLFWPLVAASLLAWAGGVSGADLVIRIPGDLSQQDGFYRLDYRHVNSNRKFMSKIRNLIRVTGRYHVQPYGRIRCIAGSG